MKKIQTLGLCGEVVSVEESSSFDWLGSDPQSLTTLKCVDGTRSEVMDTVYAKRKGIYQLMVARVCPGCPRRRPQ